MMKKILLLILLSVSIKSFSQIPPVGQVIGSPKTITEVKNIIQADSAIFINYSFSDTALANLGLLKNIPGCSIRVGDYIYVRSSNATFWIQQAASAGAGTVTSVALSMPSAFTVSNSPVTHSGTLTVTGNGTTLQYIRGDGTLATFPTIPSQFNPIAGIDITLTGSYPNITFNADTTTGSTKLATQGYVLRNIPATSTLQQIFNTQVGGAVLTKTDTVLVAASNGWHLGGRTASYWEFKDDSSGTIPRTVKMTTQSSVPTMTITANNNLFSTPQEQLMITNPATSGAVAQAMIGFSAYDGSSVTKNGWVGYTSNSFTSTVNTANMMYIESAGTGGLGLFSGHPTLGDIRMYSGGYSDSIFERLVVHAAGDVTIKGRTGNGTVDGLVLQQIPQSDPILSLIGMRFLNPISGVNKAPLQTAEIISTAGNYSSAAVNLPSRSLGLLQEVNNGAISLIAGGSGSDIRFTAGGYAAASEIMRIVNTGVGIGTLGAPNSAKILHTVGAIRLASLGTSSADTTTYKPIGIDGSGNIIPITYWPGSGSGGGGSPAGNYGNIQINRNGAFAAAASDSLGYTTTNGFVVKNKLGILDASPASALTVGSGDLFQVNSSGNIVKINNVTTSWPSSQGTLNSSLINDGNGNLSWTPPSYIHIVKTSGYDSLGWFKSDTVFYTKGIKFTLPSGATVTTNGAGTTDSTLQVDFTGLITATTYTFAKSVANSSSTITLVNDSTNLEGTKVYASDAGVRTWYRGIKVVLTSPVNGELLRYKSSDTTLVNTANLKNDGTTITATLPTTTGTTTSSGLVVLGNSLTSGTGTYMPSSTLTSGNIVNIISTSTALAAGNEGLNIDFSGANGTNAITATGARISVTNTNGTSGTNTALSLTASGATTNNFAINVSSGDSYFGNNPLYGNSNAYNNQTGTTYTLQSSDNGKIVTISNASAITLTIGAGLPAGFNCTVVQKGAGQITFTASSTTIHNRQSFTKTAGQYSIVAVVMYGSDLFITQGDMQ